MVGIKKTTSMHYSFYFVLPALAIYLFFNIMPMLSGFVYSFTNWTTMNPDIKFIGFEQFRRIFRLRYIGLAIKNTVIFTITTTAFRLAFGLALAFALNRAMRGRNILRSIFFSTSAKACYSNINNYFHPVYLE